MTIEAHADEVVGWARSAPNWSVLGFEEEMEYVYAAADLVISRSGAMTISELEATGTPAIVVPLPAGKGYQALNAASLGHAGGAVIVEQTAPDAVVRLAFDLMADPDRRTEMAAGAASVRRRGVADTVAAMTLELVDA